MFLCILEKDTTGIRKEDKYLSSSWILQKFLKYLIRSIQQLCEVLPFLFINFKKLIYIYGKVFDKNQTPKLRFSVTLNVFLNREVLRGIDSYSFLK